MNNLKKNKQRVKLDSLTTYNSRLFLVEEITKWQPQRRHLRKQPFATTVGHVKKPITAAKNVGKKEYYLPLPDNKAGKFLNKKRRFIPKFFREAWQELKLVSWPDRKETAKLTLAVLVFAIIFGATIALVDYGLDKVFKELLLK